MNQAVIEMCMEPRKGSRSAVLWGLSSHPLLPHTDSALALPQLTLPQTSAFPHITKQRKALPFHGVSVLYLYLPGSLASSMVLAVPPLVVSRSSFTPP